MGPSRGMAGDEGCRVRGEEGKEDFKEGTLELGQRKERSSPAPDDISLQVHTGITQQGEVWGGGRQ